MYGIRNLSVVLVCGNSDWFGDTSFILVKQVQYIGLKTSNIIENNFTKYCLLSAKLSQVNVAV